MISLSNKRALVSYIQQLIWKLDEKVSEDGIGKHPHEPRYAGTNIHSTSHRLAPLIETLCTAAGWQIVGDQIFAQGNFSERP